MKAHKFQDVYILIALLLLSFLARLPSLEEPFDNDSSANAYHARMILSGEPLYGTHHPVHHMPGIGYTYALIFALLGESTISVKLVLVPWTALTAWLVYRLGCKLKDQQVGGLAAVFFIAITSLVMMKGTTAELELFANLPVVWAISLALQFTENTDRLSQLFWSGIMCGLALFYKASLFFPLVVDVAILSVLFWQDVRIHKKVDTNPFLDFARRSAVILIGLGVVVLPVLGVFAWQGVLDRFFLVFSMGEEYVGYTSTLPAYRIILIPLIILAYNSSVMLVFCLAGVLRLVYALRRGSPPPAQFSAALITWLLMSFLIIGITRVGFVHYALIAVPPLALLSAWEICSLLMQVQERWKLKGAWYAAPMIAILSIIAASSLYFNYISPYHYTRYRLGLASYEEFLEKGTFEGPSLVVSLKIASYIAGNTTPVDYIYNWSESSQIYYYSGRRSPIETITPFYATTLGSYERIFVPQTQYIILGHSIYVEVPDWMRTELAQAYQLETVIGDYELYRRQSP